MDHFSPVAPAYIRVLVLPVGNIESARFSSLVRRLQSEASIIPLTDVEQRGGDDAAFLSPKAFPQGLLLYRFSAAAPSEHHEKISPYEFFREPLIVLGVVDGRHNTDESDKRELARATAYLRERHPRVVHRQLILLEDDDGEAEAEAETGLASAIRVVHGDQSDHPSLRSAVNELSARFLLEFTTYAKAVQASPTIQTPGQTTKGLQRHGSLRESEKRPSSGHGDSSHASSPTEDGRTSDSLPLGRPAPMPATSFDQMPSAMSGNFQRRESETSTQSSKSKSRARSSSQDRIPTQGFGTSNSHGERFVATGFGQSSSQEKTRARGKARVGIVVGSIYMMSGQWSEALRLLAESTTISQALTDHLWHAKGLENMMVCMMLLVWADADFKVPKICDLASDKASASKFSRVSSNPPGVPRESAESAKDKSQRHRLSVVVPGLARKILTLLRSPEGSLELPFLVFAEASVRIAKLLAALNATNGELTHEKLRAFVIVEKEADSSRGTRLAGSFIDGSKPFSKTAIAEVLTQALPFGGDALATSDHIRLLAGVASAYSMIGFDRKKAMTIKEAVTKLTGALMQARKLGAAEMGIHPAASLSTDTGVDTLLAIAAESNGLTNLMTDVSSIYGASLFPSSRTDAPIFADTKTFGNPTIKFDILKALSGFCEAAPDPHGVLVMTAALLRAAGPNAAIDAAPEPVMNAFSREEQMHLATVISRTVAVSKHLGLVDVQAVYWDPFLVRGVEVMQPAGHKAIIDRTKLNGLEASVDQLTPGNPLLYDPNASRPGTAIKQTSVIVQDEPSQCVITLQNPYDIPVDIEDLSLVTDGIELTSQHEPITLGPLRFQRVSLMVHAASVGAAKIVGCRIKMQGCFPQVFPIVTKAWSARNSVTAKTTGLESRPTYNDKNAKYDLKGLGIEPTDVPVAVVENMPTLVLEFNPEVDSGVMLLEGEMYPLTMWLRNASMVSASVFDITDTAEVLSIDSDAVDGFSTSTQVLVAESGETIVPPGALVPFQFKVLGRAGVAMTQVNFYYCVNGRASKHVRVASVPLEMTVNAVLQVQNLEIMRSPAVQAGMVEVSIDVRNAWPSPVSYSCNVHEDDLATGEVPRTKGSLAPGQIRRVLQTVPVSSGASGFEANTETLRARFLSNFRLCWEVDMRSGVADLQGLALSQESLEVLRGSPINVSVAVVGHQKGSKKLEVAVGSFVRVQAKLLNCGKRSAPLILQLSKTPNLDSKSVLEERRFSVAGTSKRLLPPLEIAAERMVEFIICPLIAGALDLEVVLGQMTYDENESNWHSTQLLSLSVHDEHEE